MRPPSKPRVAALAALAAVAVLFPTAAHAHHGPSGTWKRLVRVCVDREVIVDLPGTQLDIVSCATGGWRYLRATW